MTQNPNEPQDPNKKQNPMEIAEVRMVLYVIPVAIVFIIAALILSRCGAGA